MTFIFLDIPILIKISLGIINTRLNFPLLEIEHYISKGEKLSGSRNIISKLTPSRYLYTIRYLMDYIRFE